LKYSNICSSLLRMRWDGLRLHDQPAESAPPAGAEAAQGRLSETEQARTDAAMAQARGGADRAREQARGGADRAREQARGGADRAREQARGGADRAREQARGGADRAREQARGGSASAAEQTRPGAARAAEPAQATLFGRDAVARTFDTPAFRGMTFYEVHARSIINKVPDKSRMPFRWTINPYRGCGHACVYCYARGTHSYLDLDTGLDFDSKIVVKVNAAELARKELSRPRWPGEHVAMGTNVDCYQRAEGRYRLMPGIIGALRDAANPFSILTKGTLLLRDLDLIEAAAAVTRVGLNISVGFVDAELSGSVEPGTPSPQRRLDMCAEITGRGLSCGVLMGPVLPYLSDSPAQLDQTVRQIAAAGAASVTPIVLHLRPGAREWYQAWLRANHPGLVERYRDLYGNGSYARRDYQQRISAAVAELAIRHGVGRASPAAARRISLGPGAAPPPRPRDPAADAGGVQLALI
jgi:DNA repair photolyase